MRELGIEGSQVGSMAFDGAYFNTKVDDLLRESFGLNEESCPATWDWMHRLGLADKKVAKDDEFKWLLDIVTLCSDIFNKFNYGNYHELLCNDFTS